MQMIDRTPLPEVGELSVPWVVEEAPPLIANILRALAEPEEATATELEPEQRRRAETLAALRDGPRAPSQIPRDLATLQRLLLEVVRREIPEREPGDFARAAGRLVDVFGSIQGEVTRSLVESRSGGAAHDPVTGLPGPVQLDEWLRVLLAEQRRYGHPFALALVDVDGLSRINEAHGRPTGDRMLAAVAGVLRRQLRDVDAAFRLEEDEFAILAPHSDAAGLVPLANRIAELITTLAGGRGPADRDCGRGRLLPDRRVERRAPARERRGGDLRSQGGRGRRRPQLGRHPDRRARYVAAPGKAL